MDWVKLLDTVGGWANAVGGLANAVGILVGAIVAIFTIRKVEPALRPRNRLKADFEILRMLKPNEPYYKEVRREIDKTLARIYKRRLKVYNRTDLILGIIFLPSLSFWTWYLVKDGFSWWAIVTGFFAFAALGWILNAFEEKTTKIERAKE